MSSRNSLLRIGSLFSLIFSSSSSSSRFHDSFVYTSERAMDSETVDAELLQYAEFVQQMFAKKAIGDEKFDYMEKLKVQFCSCARHFSDPVPSIHHQMFHRNLSKKKARKCEGRKKSARASCARVSWRC